MYYDNGTITWMMQVFLKHETRLYPLHTGGLSGVVENFISDDHIIFVKLIILFV